MVSTDAQPDAAAALASDGDPRFVDHLASAADLVAAGRFDEGERALVQALGIKPLDARALKLLALVRFKLGHLDEAYAVCRELVIMLPDDAGVHMKLGLIALKMDRHEEAVRELELCTRLAPEDARGWSYLGFAYARAGDGTRAAAAFRQAGQEESAAEAERGAELPAPVSASEADRMGVWSGADPSAEPLTRVDGDAADTVEVAAADRASPGDASLEGALPVAPYDPDFQDFDLPEPLANAASARTNLGVGAGLGSYPHGRSASPPRAVTPPFGERAEAGVPVSPLVGYAVSRLAPASEAAAWVGATACFPIGEEIFVRADAAVACSGTARWEPAYRRVRGRATDERLGGDGVHQQAFCRVTGRGDLFVAAPTGRLVPLRLEDDILYVREDHVLAFEGSISWEYGHVPRAPATGRMLQFRGRGLVALRVEGEPGAVKVTPERAVLVSSAHLLGWVGPVAASGSGRPGEDPIDAASAVDGTDAFGFGEPFGVTCEGEGVVLIDVKLGPPGRALGGRR